MPTVASGSDPKISETDAPSQGAFYIQSTGPSSRPRHTLKNNDSFLVCDNHGDIGASPGGPDGLFDHDTRFLSRLELLINGVQPLLLGSSIRDDNVSLSVDLTNPDIHQAGAIVLARDTIHIVRTVYVWGGVAHQRIHVVNHADIPVDVVVTLFYQADFLDLFEARGMRRDGRGRLSPVTVEGGTITFGYLGLDRKRRSTVLRLDPLPDRANETVASYDLSLPSGASWTLYLAAECDGEVPARSMPFAKGILAANRHEKAMTRNVATVETSNEIFNEVLCRSMADLSMLMTETPQGAYPYAGTPWYSTTFGRDGIITALQMLWIDPSVAKGVLGRLAHLQATEFDAASDAEPGKILHEMRGGEMAALREVPFGLYYGSIDATPLFVVLAGE